MSARLWVEEGLSERTAERVAAAGITDAPALAAWVAEHEEGDQHIGRVMRAELHNWLTERALLLDPETHTAAKYAEERDTERQGRLAHIPGAADLI